MTTFNVIHDANYYVALDYPVELARRDEDEESYWVCEIPDLPGCVADGETPAEAIESLSEAKRLWIQARLEHGHRVPEPTNRRGGRDYSGRLLLRMPKSLHRKLAAQSRREGTSLNMYVVSLLSERAAYNAGGQRAVAETAGGYGE